MDTHTHPRKWNARLGIGGLALLACIAVALCGLIATPRAAHAAVGDYGTLEDGTYTVTASLSAWMNWDVTDGSTSNNAKLQSYHHHGGANQVWKITTDSDGYSTIINVKSGKALDVPDGTAANGKQLQQYTPNGTKAQKWKIIERSTGYKICSAVDESYVIDLYDAEIDDGTAIQLYQDNSTKAQRWHIDKVADQTTTELPDQTRLFDSSVYITASQAGTYTWETVPDGWEVQEGSNIVEDGHDDAATAALKTKKLQYKNGLYSGGDAVAVLRVDKCCKVDGKWVSIRLTFSNIAGLPDAGNSSNIRLKNNNIWKGVVAYGIAQMDMKIELFESDSGEPISLKGAWFTGASLNHKEIQDEGIRYLAEEPFESCLIKGHGLEMAEDGDWHGSRALWYIEWEDWVGGNNFVFSSVGFHLVDDSPTFRLFNSIYSYSESNYTKFCINLSPLTITTPPSPTKNVEITE